MMRLLQETWKHKGDFASIYTVNLLMENQGGRSYTAIAEEDKPNTSSSGTAVSTILVHLAKNN